MVAESRKCASKEIARHPRESQIGPRPTSPSVCHMGLGQGYVRDIFTSQRAPIGDNFLQKVDRLGSGCVS